MWFSSTAFVLLFTTFSRKRKTSCCQWTIYLLSSLPPPETAIKCRGANETLRKLDNSPASSWFSITFCSLTAPQQTSATYIATADRKEGKWPELLCWNTHWVTAYYQGQSCWGSNFQLHFADDKTNYLTKVGWRGSTSFSAIRFAPRKPLPFP